MMIGFDNVAQKWRNTKSYEKAYTALDEEYAMYEEALKNKKENPSAPLGIKHI